MTNIGLAIIIATELGLTVIETVVHSGGEGERAWGKNNKVSKKNKFDARCFSFIIMTAMTTVCVLSKGLQIW